MKGIKIFIVAAASMAIGALIQPLLNLIVGEDEAEGLETGPIGQTTEQPADQPAEQKTQLELDIEEFNKARKNYNQAKEELENTRAIYNSIGRDLNPQELERIQKLEKCMEKKKKIFEEKGEKLLTTVWAS